MMLKRRSIYTEHSGKMRFSYEFSSLFGSSYRGGNVVFTPDGNTVLAAVGNKVSVFDLVQHRCYTLPTENDRDIVALALSPDGNLLVSADEGGGILLINFHKRVLLNTMKVRGQIRRIEFSPDSKFLAVAVDRVVFLWRAPPLDALFSPFVRLHSFRGHFDDVLRLTWSSDSKFLFTCSKDHTVKMYSVYEDDEFRPLTLAGHRDRVVACFLDQNLSLYTVSRDGALFVWSFAPDEASEVPSLAHGRFQLEKKHFFKKDGAKVICAEFHHSKNFSLLVVGFDSGLFGLYDMPECNEIHTLSISQQKISTVSINSSGEWLAFGSKKLGQLLVWEWQSETYVLKQQGHFYDVNTLAYSPDGQLIVTGGDDGKVKIWNADSGFCFVTFSDHTGPVSDVTFTTAGNVVLSASLDGTVRAYDLVRYRQFRTLVSPKHSQFTTLSIDPSGEIVCAGAMDPFDIYVWSLQSGRLLDVLSGHEGPISALSFSAERSLLASASWDATVRTWDVFERKASVETFNHSSDVLALSFRADGNEICSSALDGQLYFWNVETGKLKGVIEARKDAIGGRRRDDAFAAKNSSRSTCFNSVSYSPDGSCVLGGCNGKFVCLWEISQRMLLRKFQISRNQSLDGVVDELDSRLMTDAGAIDTIDDPDDDEDLAEKLDRSNFLPGAKTGDFSKRKTRPSIRSKCVRFAPTGRCFGAATTEGLLIYSLDADMTFDPVDLDVDVTPINVQKTFERRQYSKALVMALRLNEDRLIKLVLEHTPPKAVNLVLRSIDPKHLEKLLNLMADGLEGSALLELYLRWCSSLLTIHGDFLKKRSSSHLSAFRALQKNLGEMYNTMSSLCNSNEYRIQYLLAQARRQENLQELDSKRPKTSEDDDDDDDNRSHC